MRSAIYPVPIVLALIVWAPAARPQNLEADVKAVMDRLQERRDISPIKYTLSWVDNRWPAAERTDPRVGTGSGMVAMDFANRRLRGDTVVLLKTKNSPSSLASFSRTMRFDGQETWEFTNTDFSATSAPVNPSRVHIINRRWGADGLWPEELQPILWSHGILWSDDESRLVVPIDWQPAPNQFSVVGREPVVGRDCIVIRDTIVQKGHDRKYWIDMERGGLVLQRQESSEKHGVRHIFTYREANGTWLPSGWTKEGFRLDKAGTDLIITARVNSANIVAAIPVNEFRISPMTGTTVMTMDDEYFIHPNGTRQSLQRTPDPARMTFGQKLWSALGRARWFHMVALATALALIVVLAKKRLWRRSFNNSSAVNGTSA